MRFYQNTITDNENTEHKNTKNINTKNKNTKVRSQKKTILFGNFSQTSDPPPRFWEPLIQKKILVFILDRVY